MNKTKNIPWRWDPIYQQAFDNGKAAIAKETVLAYPDFKETMNAALYWKGMRTTIWSLTKSCRSYQINKRRSRRYGHLPPKTVITIPWECWCVDLIGLYTLQGKDNLLIDFMALTMIDPASSWFEIAELPVVEGLRWQTVDGKELPIADKIFDKTLEHIAKLVNKTWLCRYPPCYYLIYDNGSEFRLHFEYLCESYGIMRKPTTVKNPQANSILELVHQVLGQMLRTAELDMANSVTPNDVNVFLDNAAWAICSTCHMVLKASPGAAIFLTWHALLHSICGWLAQNWKTKAITDQLWQSAQER
jgi:hypothetical protein